MHNTCQGDHADCMCNESGYWHIHYVGAIELALFTAGIIEQKNS